MNWRMIGVAAVFNLLFEYSARGIGALVRRPFLFVLMFGIYLAYFTILEGLILRYRLKNHQVVMVAFLWGLFPSAFLTGNLFSRSAYGGVLLFGVNIGTLLVICLLAWGILQGIVTLYLANRVSPRKWHHKPISLLTYLLPIGYLLGVFALGLQNPVKPSGTAVGWLFWSVLVGLSMFLVCRSLRQANERAPWGMETSPVMDLLSFGSVAVFFMLGTFVDGQKIVTSHPLNHRAVVLEHYWLFLVAVVYVGFRVARGRDVTT